MRRTNIVATVGPASAEPATLGAMIDAGVSVFRIGLAHGSLDDHLETYRLVRAATADNSVGVLVDLPGPKVRCAPFPAGGVELADGQAVRVVAGTSSSSRDVIEVDYEGVVDDLLVGDRLAFGDGQIVAVVEEKSPGALVARLIHGGLIQGRPGLQVPSSRLSLPTPTPADLKLVDAFVEHDVDMIAVSFVRSAHDVRRVGVEASPRGPLVVAKVETSAAVENLEPIITASGAIMVARGDLGTDYALSDLPHLQKHIIRRCVARGRPVITATQMLESMVYAPAPTRAEASDVANAVFDGSSAVMLSGETAIGIDPVNAVSTMAEISQRADEEFDHARWGRLMTELREEESDVAPDAVTTDALTMAACRIADQVDASAILCLSRSGFTVRSVTRFRPKRRILAFSPDPRTVRQLALSWGTEAALTPERTTPGEMRDDALRLARERFGIATGHRVVVISGQSTETRATDTLRVVRIP